MQMSAEVCRKAVCGPGCAEIVAVYEGDIGHILCTEAAQRLSLGNGARLLLGQAKTAIMIWQGVAINLAIAAANIKYS
jgi:hypothetical protein